MTQDGQDCSFPALTSFGRSTVNLEFIDDVLPRLPKDREITILVLGGVNFT